MPSLRPDHPRDGLGLWSKLTVAWPAALARPLTWLCLGAVLLPADAAEWTPQAAVTATWNTNATNSDRDADEIGALAIQASAAATRRFAVARDDTIFLGAAVELETWPRFDGLNRLTLGPRAAWQHKLGLGALAPVLRVDLAAEVVAAQETEREGFTGRAGISWQQRIDESTRISLGFEQARHNARAAVFDRTGSEATIEVGRDVTEHWQLTVAARWRTGDIVSYARPPRPDLVELAKVRSTVSTFDEPRIVYSLGAQTLGGSLRLTRTLDEQTSLAAGYEYRQTKRSFLRYGNQLVSLTLARQF